MEAILKTSKWMHGSGEHADIVISSRIRLARNIQDFNFAISLDRSQAKDLVEKVKNAIDISDLQEKFKEIRFLRIEDLDDVKKKALVEKHLVSPQFIQGDLPKGLMITKDDEISMMINEEDHLRIQCILPALQLREAWKLANKVDDYLEEHLDFAYDENYGYLTSCPTNVGTGLRASIMVHLPGLAMTNQIEKIFAALPKIGLTVRGLYGEGSKAVGNIFQISNQVTLGQSEEEIINNLQAVCEQIVEQELLARKILKDDWSLQLEDRIGRALGILTNARLMSSDEALKLFSDLRIGIDLKLIQNISLKTINYLMFLIQPAALQIYANRNLDAQGRDEKRAEIIREEIKNKEK